MKQTAKEVVTMKKRLFFSFLTAILFTLALSSFASASTSQVTYDVEGGRIFFDTATGTVTGYDPGVKSAVIPAQINGVTVTAIGENAFWYCRSLTEVVLPETVTQIGAAAFRDCILLSRLNLPTGLTEISDWAFANTGLTQVTIPDGVTTIGICAFYDCDELTDITIPDSVTSIGASAFRSCAFTSFSIPKGITVIAEGTFEVCTSLTELSIPRTVTTIEKDAFSSCGFTSFMVPDHVTSLGEGVFDGCKNLRSVIFSTSITAIPRLALRDCTALEEVIIPGSVTFIGDRAFSGCTSLTGITIPGSVTSIGDEAFRNTGLLSVSIPGSATDLGDNLFNGCKSLVSVSLGSGITTVPTGIFSSCYELKRVTLPTTVKTIETYAFYGCEELSNLVIPASVTTIGDDAFNYCNKLVVYYTGSAEQWRSVKTGARNYLGEELGVRYEDHRADVYPYQPVSGFADVVSGEYFADAVTWATSRNIVTGTSATSFSPFGLVTRSQAVTILWRAMGCPEPASLEPRFVDVTNPDAYYYKAVIWAAEQGIVHGTGNSYFTPADQLTNVEMMAMIGKVEGRIDLMHWADSAIEFAESGGLTDGLDDINPKNPCYRSDMVYMLWKWMTTA